MNATSPDVDSAAFSLVSWERQRSSEELRSFVELRHAALPADIAVE